MRESTKFYFNNLEPISERCYKLLSNLSFSTGSRVFGGYSDESDYDFLISASNFSRLNKKYSIPSCYDSGEYNTDFFEVVYLKYQDKVLNVLIFKDDFVYKLYVDTTKIVRFLVRFTFFRKLCESKDMRVLLFESMLYILSKQRGIFVIEPPNYKYISGSGDDIPF